MRAWHKHILKKAWQRVVSRRRMMAWLVIYNFRYMGDGTWMYLGEKTEVKHGIHK